MAHGVVRDLSTADNLKGRSDYQNCHMANSSNTQDITHKKLK